MAKPHNDLAADYVRSILGYNPETGDLVWKVAKGRRVRSGDVAGHLNGNGYVYVRVDGAHYLSHRLVWLIHYDRWPKDQIDHINGDRADNRVENLREATNAENHQNKSSCANSSSSFVGVHWEPRCGTWQAQITLGGKQKYLGSFHSEEAAAAAYAKAKAELHTFNPMVRPTQTPLGGGIPR